MYKTKCTFIIFKLLDLKRAVPFRAEKEKAIINLLVNHYYPIKINFTKLRSYFDTGRINI